MGTILITIDCLRADRIFPNKNMKYAENINSFAQENRAFSNAYSVGCRTATAFPAILSSTYPSANGGPPKLSKEQITISQHLNDGKCVGIHSNPYLTTEFGYSRGFDEFLEINPDKSSRIELKRKEAESKVRQYFNEDSSWLSILRKVHNRIFSDDITESGRPYTDAHETTQKAKKALSRIDDIQLLWVHYMDLHRPYPLSTTDNYSYDINAPKEEIESAIEKLLISNANLTPDERKIISEVYDAELGYIDYHIGKLIEYINENEFNIIICSDHGQLLGEDGRYFHPNLVMNKNLLHVPLIIGGNDIKKRISQELVSLLDIPPTICEMNGENPHKNWSGNSLYSKDDGESVVLAEGIEDFPNKSNNPEIVSAISDDKSVNIPIYDGEPDFDESASDDMKQKIRTHISDLSLETTGDSIDTEIGSDIEERLESLGYR